MDDTFSPHGDAVRRSCRVLRSGLARSVSIVSGKPFSPEELTRLRAIAASEGVVIAEYEPGVIKLRANGLPAPESGRRVRAFDWLRLPWPRRRSPALEGRSAQ